VANFTGTSGNDVYTGGVDPDSIVGNGGDDSLSGNSGNDTIVGGTGADLIDGGDGDDVLFSGPYTAPVHIPTGTPGPAPTLDTGSEIDTLDGGAGDDRIFAGYGDQVDGGSSTTYGDYLYISFMGAPSGVNADFTQPTVTIGGGTIQNIENISWIQGSNYDDTINLNGSAFRDGYTDLTAIFAGGGNDHVIAGYYTGYLYGEAGDDTLDGRNSLYLQRAEGGDGNDTIYINTSTFAQAYGGNGDDTIYSGGFVSGGAGNDHIVMQLSVYTSRISGDAGDDTIEAVAAGNPNNYGNSIAGGDGADSITGGAHDDLLVSGNWVGNYYDYAADNGLEHDHIAGGDGNDTIAIGYGDDADGGNGSDTLNLSLGGATSGVTIDLTGITGATPYNLAGGTIQNFEDLAHLTGSAFGDTITVGTQTNLLLVDGAGGNDQVIASGSSVNFNGGTGDDTFVSGIAGDRFDGGDGFDTADYSHYGSGIAVTLGATAGVEGSGPGGDVLVNVEQVLGSAFADTLAGGATNDLLVGNDGADSILGNAGADIVTGGAGADTIDGGDGNDHLYGQSATGGSDGADSISGGNGIDYLQGNAGNDTLDGGAQADRINGGADNDHISGGDGNDIVNGNLGNDLIDGGAGSDSLRGGQGDDQILGGDGNDTLSGDLGSDYMAGGAGADLFRFAGADSNAAGGIRDEIADFIHGIDHIALPFVPTALVTGSAADQASAITAANAAMVAHAGFHEAALIQVGSDTYLFASASGATDNADLMIKLDGVNATQVALGDFV